MGSATEERDIGAAECASGALGPRCEGVSALGMRACDGGTQLGDPVCWPQAMGVQMGLSSLS